MMYDLSLVISYHQAEKKSVCVYVLLNQDMIRQTQPY